MHELEWIGGGMHELKWIGGMHGLKARIEYGWKVNEVPDPPLVGRGQGRPLEQEGEGRPLEQEGDSRTRIC
jgi:hypothetical protein